MIFVPPELCEFSPQETFLQEEGQNKGTPGSEAGLFGKESQDWTRKPNLRHEIELQTIKMSTWNSGQNTDCNGKKNHPSSEK